MTAPIIEAPAIVRDLPDPEYRDHPALSQSAAKRLLPPSCPAIFRWERDNLPPPKPHFDVGRAAHKLILGTGPGIVLVDEERWDTKITKEKVAGIRATGNIPLKRGDYQAVHEMAAQLARHPVASRLFDAEHGDGEVSLFWTDAGSGIGLKARLDWLPDPHGERLIIGDYKTADKIDPWAFGKSAADYSYVQQAPWYLDGVAATLEEYDAAFLFVAQMKTPPYLISIYQPTDDALTYGRRRNREAVDLYAQCVADDNWPGYSIDVEPLPLPSYLRNYE